MGAYDASAIGALCAALRAGATPLRACDLRFNELRDAEMRALTDAVREGAASGLDLQLV